MDDGRSSRRRTPFGVFGAVALVAAVEVGLSQVPVDAWPSSFIAASWAESERASRTRGEGVGADVLILGDSQLKCGLQPKLIEGALGLRAFNLAVVGGQPASSYYLLSKALDSGATPKAIVVDFFPGLLAADLRINTGKWADLLDPGECLGLASTARDGKLFGPVIARALLPALRLRDGVRAGVTAALTGVEGKDAAEARAYVRNWRVNGGSHALPRKPEFRESEGDVLDPSQPGRRWKCKPENLAYVRRFLALAGSHKIPVFWVLPTVAPRLRAERGRTGLDAAYLAFVRSVRAEFPGLTVLDPTPLLGDAGVFSDVLHLDRRGASVLTLAVAEAVAGARSDAPGVGRWVAMKPPSASRLASDVPVEDVAESAAAVRGGAGLRR